MNKAKKSVSFLLAVVICFISFAFCGSADSGILEKTGDDKRLIIDIKPDKDSYRLGDTASVTVKVTNRYGFEINNLIISLESSDCKLPRGEKSKSQIKEILAANDSFSDNFKIKLGSNAKLGFFQRILFFFLNLFNPSDNISPSVSGEEIALKNEDKYIDNYIYKNSLDYTVKFGSADCGLTVIVRYDVGINSVINGKTDDNTLPETAEDKAKAIIKELESLELIKNVQQDKERDCYWYKFLQDGSEAIGGLDYSEPATESDSQPAESAEPAEGNNNTPLLILGDGNHLSDFKELSDDYGKYQLTQPGAGYIDASYENLNKKEFNCTFIFVSCHGGVCSLLDGMPYIRLTNCPENESEFIGDLVNNCAGILTRLIKSGGKIVAKKYGILFPKFFEDKSFKNTVVFLGSCCGFGNDSEKTDFAESLCEKGCKAVIGFQKDVVTNSSIAFMKKFVESFSEGESLKDCFKQSEDIEWNGATPCLYVNNESDKNATILDCGPNGGNLAAVRIQLWDAINNIKLKEFPLIITKADNTIGNDFVTEFLNKNKLGTNDKKDGWDHYTLSDSVNHEKGIKEIIVVRVDVDDD